MRYVACSQLLAREPEAIILVRPVGAPCFRGPSRVASAIFPGLAWSFHGRRTRAESHAGG